MDFLSRTQRVERRVGPHRVARAKMVRRS